MISTLRVQNDGFFESRPSMRRSVAVLRIHEDPAFDQQHVLAQRCDDQRRDAVGDAVVDDGVIGQIDLRPLRLAVAHHLLLGIEPRPEHLLADVTRAAFGRHFVAKAPGRVEIGPASIQALAPSFLLLASRRRSARYWVGLFSSRARNRSTIDVELVLRGDGGAETPRTPPLKR